VRNVRENDGESYTDPEKESDHRFTQIVDIVAQQCGLVSRPLYEIKYAQ
jgi:hypothetical protein